MDWYSHVEGTVEKNVNCSNVFVTSFSEFTYFFVWQERHLALKVKSVPLIPKRFVLEQSEEENRGGWLNWLTQVHLEMS